MKCSTFLNECGQSRPALTNRSSVVETVVPRRNPKVKAKETLTRRFVGSWIAALMIATLAPQQAYGQSNLLENSGFEDVVAPNFGNNIGFDIGAWTLGGGDDANVVRVDGNPGGQNLTGITFGPEFDAQNNGNGLPAISEQHYLNIANGKGVDPSAENALHGAVS